MTQLYKNKASFPIFILAKHGTLSYHHFHAEKKTQKEWLRFYDFMILLIL